MLGPAAKNLQGIAKKNTDYGAQNPYVNSNLGAFVTQANAS